LRNIITVYIYITRLASKEIFLPSNKIHLEVGRAKDLSAYLYLYIYIYIYLFIYYLNPWHSCGQILDSWNCPENTAVYFASVKCTHSSSCKRCVFQESVCKWPVHNLEQLFVTVTFSMIFRSGGFCTAVMYSNPIPNTTLPGIVLIVCV